MSNIRGCRLRSSSGEVVQVLDESGSIDIEVISDPKRFRALKPEWDQLWSRSRNGGLFQSFDCCYRIWQTIALPENNRLFCAAGRIDGRMVAAFAGRIYRRKLWRFLQPLDASGAEFADILLDDSLDQQSWVTTILSVLYKSSTADVLVLPYVRRGTPLDSVVSHKADRPFLEHDVAFYAHLKDEVGWSTYHDSLSKRHQGRYASLRRRLAQMGSTQFEIIPAGDARCPALIRWMLFQKRIWLQRSGKQGPWLYSENYQAFLMASLADSEADPKCVMMCLFLNGKPIAVKIAAIGKSIIEGLIAGFDAQYAKLSPGMMLDEHWVKWALEQNLDCDFGNGGEHYKRYWSRGNLIPTTTYRIAMSSSGRLLLLVYAARQHLRSLTLPKKEI